MPSVLNQPFFQDEEAAYAKLEGIVWPNGATCPHCGSTDRMKKMGGTATRPGLYKCYACRKQSRVTVGTVFESSHVKLHAWLQAMYLLCSSKKGISSNQLARTLGVTVKTAWFMSHRLREAMTAGTVLPPMGGAGVTVEIDETFIGQKKDMPKQRGYAHKHAILTLVERGRGSRSFHVDGTKADDLLPIIKANVEPGTARDDGRSRSICSPQQALRRAWFRTPRRGRVWPGRYSHELRLRASTVCLSAA